MDCGEYLRQISKHIDGELSEEDRKRVETHMSECSECSAFFQRMTSVNNAISSAPLAYNRRALIQKVKDRLDQRTAPDKQRLSLWEALPIYALLLILALGLGNLAGSSLYRVIPDHQANAALELLAPEHENSLAEAILDIGGDLNSK
jgi:anti-sigma factor RsiW